MVQNKLKNHNMMEVGCFSSGESQTKSDMNQALRFSRERAEYVYMSIFGLEYVTENRQQIQNPNQIIEKETGQYFTRTVLEKLKLGTPNYTKPKLIQPQQNSQYLPKDFNRPVPIRVTASVPCILS